MLVYIGKLILFYILFITSIRLLGKSALAQLTPHDFGAILFLSYIAFGGIEIDGITQSIIGLVVVILVHITTSRLTLFKWINRMIIGGPIILIKHGKVVPENLKRSRYSMVELLSCIRTAGYPDIKDVEYAILEPVGDITVLPKKDIGPVTPKHLNIKVDDRGLPIAVVVEGKIQRKNLKLINKDEQWLKEKLKSEGYDHIHNIFYASVKDKDYSLIVQIER